MYQGKPRKPDPILTFLNDSRKIILTSLAISFVMFLLSFGVSRAEQSYAFTACAILWGLSLVALAVIDNKKDADSDS